MLGHCLLLWWGGGGKRWAFGLFFCLLRWLGGVGLISFRFGVGVVRWRC